jgi:hypothetical protein
MAAGAARAPAGFPERLEIKPRRWRIALALLGCAGFVALGALLLAAPRTGLLEKAVGALSIAFFGWCLLLYPRRLKRRMRLALTSQGLWWGGPSFAPKLIRWAEIESLSVASVSGQDFNAIAMADPTALIAQFGEREARETLHTMRVALGFAKAALPIALAHGDAGDLPGVVRAGRAGDLAEMFAFLRARYGGEILISWAERDRNAARFDALLRAWRACFAQNGLGDQ